MQREVTRTSSHTRSDPPRPRSGGPEPGSTRFSASPWAATAGSAGITTHRTQGTARVTPSWGTDWGPEAEDSGAPGTPVSRAPGGGQAEGQPPPPLASLTDALPVLFAAAGPRVGGKGRAGSGPGLSGRFRGLYPWLAPILCPSEGEQRSWGCGGLRSGTGGAVPLQPPLPSLYPQILSGPGLPTASENHDSQPPEGSTQPQPGSWTGPQQRRGLWARAQPQGPGCPVCEFPQFSKGGAPQ